MESTSCVIELPPTWAEPMGYKASDLLEIAKKDQHDIIDERDKIIYDAALAFSNKHEISFYLCCANALDLYMRKELTGQDVEDHLSWKFNPSSRSSKEKTPPRNCKTIMLVGKSCDGKSTLTQHITGNAEAEIGHGANSQTFGARLFVSKEHDLNVIDTEGLDGSEAKCNTKVLEELLTQIIYCFEMGASLDAIIVMWCPLKNGRSGLMKTIQALQKSFGDDVIKSCVVMIQGNWKHYDNFFGSDSSKAVNEAKNEIKKQFWNVPIIEYDAKGPIDQLPSLIEAVQKVIPYQKDNFEKKRREEFMNMARVFKIKLQNDFEKSLPEEKRQEMMRFCLDFQSRMSEAISQRVETFNRRQAFWERLRRNSRALQVFLMISGFILEAVTS